MYRGSISVAIGRQRPTRFLVHYNPARASFSARWVRGTRVLGRLLHIDDPLYCRLGTRDVSHPAYSGYLYQMSYLVRAAFCAHVEVEYPFTKLGKVAPTVRQYWIRAKEQHRPSRVPGKRPGVPTTVWHLELDRILVENLATPPTPPCRDIDKIAILLDVQLRQGKKERVQ